MCLSFLEKNPEPHIRNVIAVLTDSTLDEVSQDLKMSAGVYLKNYTGTILKTIMSSNSDTEESKRVARNQLSFLIQIFTLTVLSSTCQMRSKYNLTTQLTRFLTTYQSLDSSPQSQDSYTLLSEFVGQIIQGLLTTVAEMVIARFKEDIAELLKSSNVQSIANA